MFLYQYSKRLQEGQYENKEADYVYFLTFIWGLLAVRTSYTHDGAPADPFLM